MYINWDLRKISGRTDLEMNAEQKQFMKEIVEGDHKTMVLMGTAGVGKTILGL